MEYLPRYFQVYVHPKCMQGEKNVIRGEAGAALSTIKGKSLTACDFPRVFFFFFSFTSPKSKKEEEEKRKNKKKIQEK